MYPIGQELRGVCGRGLGDGVCVLHQMLQLALPYAEGAVCVFGNKGNLLLAPSCCHYPVWITYSPNQKDGNCQCSLAVKPIQNSSYT